MTNPEAQRPLIHWSIRPSSDSSGIYSQNQDYGRMFHLPIPMTCLQQKEQSTTTYVT
jgi:hypothetical protein